MNVSEQPRFFRARQFRLELVEKLAFETEFAETIARTGVVSPELARELGVQPDLLEEAARVARRGFRSGDINTEVGLGNAGLRVLVPKVQWRKFKLIAKQHFVRPAELLASVYHRAMLTELEPGPRPRNIKEPCLYTRCNISKGLLQALGRRAAGVGVPMRAYARSWILDVVDGKIVLPMKPIALLAMFDDPAAYVLPAVHVPRAQTG